MQSNLLRAGRWAWAVAAALTVAFALYAVTGLGGAWAYGFFTQAVYNAVLLLAVVAIALRCVAVKRERPAWLLLGGALLVWTTADTYYSLYVQDLDPMPIPSIADALWLAYYPFAYCAIVLLVRSRLLGLRRGMWLDGVIGAFAVAAICASIVVEEVLAGGIGGSSWQVATTLAYPFADVILLSITTLVLALNGWRLEATWRLLAAGFVAFAVADGFYFWQTAHETYQAGGVVDVGWLLMALLCAAAALQPVPARRASSNDGQRAAIVPATFGLVGLVLLVYGNVASLNWAAITLAMLCVLSVIARMALTFAQSHQESLRDALTGLPNRRALTRDLRERAPQARPERPLGLVIFDLNGFKAYNDRFGHPAGDALLVRLSHRLRDAIANEGIAYRMGGDEFCLLLTPRKTSMAAQVARALAALTETGEGFAIDAAHGLVSLPADEADTEDALRLADQRMYALKNGGRIPTERQTTDALLQVLTERHPARGDHADGVAELAVATGRRLSLNDVELEELALAAQLHDIGKAAVPDAILSKPGPLDADEWELMHRHPAAGERILRAAPALAGVASIVRSSHERYDGTGYPDRRAKSEIPIGARIIAVCDTFDAIISDRPYAIRRTPEQAAEELQRCAGTQFDPGVVEGFLAELSARQAPPAGAVPPWDASSASSPPR